MPLTPDRRTLALVRMWFFSAVIVLLFVFIVICRIFRLELRSIPLLREIYFYFVFHVYRYKLRRTMNSAGT